MGIFRPLVVTALMEGCLLPGCDSLIEMRMNLLGSSREDPRILFVANCDVVLVYHFSTMTPSEPPTIINRLKDPRSSNIGVSEKIINVVKVGYLGTEEVLVIANESGEVCVWFTMNLQRDPLLLNVEKSAWGIAIHAEQRLIAISCNAFTVTIFHCGMDSQISRIPFSFDSPIQMPLAGHTSQQILRGHKHNVPTVSFSPCGNYIASASVDMTCRTWRVSDGVQVQQKSLQGYWGWGVTFVDNDSWMTLTRSDYKKIPKDHLRPGKSPGQNVKDSPLSNTTFLQRPPGRDVREIRSSWFAGPLHNTSCDEFETNEDEDNERRRAMEGGEWAEYNDDMDDRDAALFGMDDDEGEDEWEELSSSDDEIEDDGGNTINEQPSDVAPLQEEDDDASADTGDDGDNEGTGMDTEDGGGFTTEDGSTKPTTSRSVKSDTLRRTAVAPLVRGMTRHDSSSELEQQTTASSKSIDADSVTVSEAENAMDITGQNNIHKSGKKNVNKESEQGRDLNQDPSYFINLEPNVESTTSCPQNLRNQVQGAPKSASIYHPEIRIFPQCPSELLLCATSRNIYLLSQNPLPFQPESDQSPRPESPHTVLNRENQVTSSLLSALLASENSTISFSDLLTFTNTGQASWIIQPTGSDVSLTDAEDDDNNNSQAMMEMAAHEEYMQWQEELAEELEMEGEYDTEYDTDPNYEDMDEYMPPIDDEQEVDDGTDNEYEDMSHTDDDSSDQYEDALDVVDPSSSHPIEGNASLNSSVSPLYAISVARAAAARVDGIRRYGYSEHYDRLFSMIIVPEISVLIAASQKGSVTIFRLLRVVDDVLISGELRGSTSSSQASSSQSDHRNKSDSNLQEGTEFSKNDVVTIHGAQYVLFPETYLPRFDPPSQPLIGISIVPILSSETSSSTFISRSKTDRFSYELGNLEDLTEHPSNPANSSSLSSFILHLAYLDSQFYSYEIRLRNEKDDPIALSSIFV